MTPCAAIQTAQKYFGSLQVGLSAFTGRPSPCVASEASKNTNEQQYVELHLVVCTQTACLLVAVHRPVWCLFCPENVSGQRRCTTANTHGQ